MNAGTIMVLVPSATVAGFAGDVALASLTVAVDNRGRAASAVSNNVT